MRQHKNSIKDNTLLFLNFFIFAISLGEGIIIPIIPLYTDQLGASYSQLGLLITGYSLGYTGLTLISGRLSDSIGRKKIILVGIAINLMAALGYIFAATAEHILIARTLEGVSRGMIWPLVTAIIADKTMQGSRTRAMGSFVACFGGGVALGTTIGGFIAQNYSYSTVFPLYVLFCFLVFVLTCFNLHEGAKENNEVQVEQIGEFIQVNVRSELRGIMPLAFLGFSFAGFLWTITALQSKLADSAGFSPLMIGIIFSVLWGTRIVAALYMGRIVDKWGSKKILIISLLSCLLATLIYPLTQELSYLIIASILTGLGTGILYPLTVSLVADRVSNSQRGLAMGLLETAMGLGMILQPTMAGLIGDYFGLAATYLLSGSFILLSIVIVIMLEVSKKVTKEQQTLTNL